MLLQQTDAAELRYGSVPLRPFHGGLRSQKLLTTTLQWAAVCKKRPTLQTTLDCLPGLTGHWFPKARANTLGNRKGSRQRQEEKSCVVFDDWRTATYYRSWLPQKPGSVNGPGGIFWKITYCAKIELTRRTSETDGTMEIKWWRFWLVVNRSDSLFGAQCPIWQPRSPLKHLLQLCHRILHSEWKSTLTFRFMPIGLCCLKPRE